jgi:cupin superfamily acireductone dioxygenase involved in methionine salvage
MKNSRAQRFEWEEVDEDGYDLAKWDYCIVDWENLTDENNNQISCTAENKIKFMQEQMGFMTFVIVSLKKLNEEKLEKLKDKEKN